MRYFLPTLLVLYWMAYTNHALAQSMEQAEPQISFVKESRTHAYYVRQAELWWQEVQTDQTAETPWFNYYRACRNAQGTANWSTDFVKESPALKLGADIVELMEQHIPETFTYYYVKGSTGGVAPDGGPYLLKAYEMNPDFPGIHSGMISYAESIQDMNLRTEINQRWFLTREYSEGFMAYGYNVLQSVAPDGLLFTQGDNDTYPIWMLQDVKGLRPDVRVINIDFLLVESYREPIFKSLGIKPFELKEIDINEYETNWTHVVAHILTHYEGGRPIHLAMTVSPRWYQGFGDALYPIGLTQQYSTTPLDSLELNRQLVEETFLLDHIRAELVYDQAAKHLANMTANYLKPLGLAYQAWLNKHEEPSAQQIKTWARQFVDRLEDAELAKQYRAIFEGE